MQYVFECSNVVPDCDERLEGETREDVLLRVGEHMREHHGMIELPADVTRWVLGSVGGDR